MILFTPVPAVATPETALAAIVTAIVTATGPSDASRATAATVHARVTAERPRRPTPATARLPAATRALVFSENASHHGNRFAQQ